MSLDDFISDVTPNGTRRGLVLLRINEKIQLPDGTVKLSSKSTQLEIDDSEIIETEKVIYSDITQITEEGIANQLGEFLDRLNTSVPFDATEGEGPFNSFQSLQFKQIPANRVLTNLDIVQTYNFEIEFQNRSISGSILGSEMTTYADAVAAINNLIDAQGGGGRAIYIPLDFKTGTHGIAFQSNTISRPSLTDNQTNSGTLSIVSTASVITAFNINYGNAARARTSNENDRASILVNMPTYNTDSILTGLISSELYSFILEQFNIPVFNQNNELITNAVEGLEGNQRSRNITVTGNGVERLDTLIDLIDLQLEDTVTLEFSTTAPNFGLLTIKSTGVEILGLSISTADLFHQMELPFELHGPVSGGKNLYEVLRYTWRSDQREWTSVIPYEWFEFRLGVASLERGTETSNGITSFGAIIPEGNTDPLDTSPVTILEPERTISIENFN